MVALTKERNTPRRIGYDYADPVKAATKIWAGSLMCLDIATGFAVPGSTSPTLRALGRAKATVDNTLGANGDKVIESEAGLFPFANSAGLDLIARTEIGTQAFIVDDQTVAKTSGGGTRSVAGTVVDITAQGVWVRISR